MPPLVSIIVPVFNESATVAAVIRRLIEVTLPAEREILVVNDGSTDGTREVLDGLPTHPAVRVIHARDQWRQGQCHTSGAGRGARLGHGHPGCRPRTRSGAAGRPGRADPARRGPRRLRFAVPAADVVRAVAHRGGEQDAHRRHQPALRLAHHRHGDLLQDHGDGGGARAGPGSRTGSTSSPRSPRSSCARATRSSSGRCASSRAAAPRGRRSAGATACARCRCWSNTAGR